MTDAAEERPVRHRNRRPWPFRATTVNALRMPRRELEADRAALEALEAFDPSEPVERPRTRGDCANGVRPCPFVSCRWHLYLDGGRRAHTIKLNFPALEPDEIPETCALDVADAGEHSLEEIGRLMNLTRERVRQLEGSALALVGEASVLGEEGGAGVKRRLRVLRPRSEGGR